MMGAFWMTSKRIQREGNCYLRATSVSRQNKRLKMEDRCTIQMCLDPIRHPLVSFFAVYDGHGGEEVAEHCRKTLHQTIAKTCEAHEPFDPASIIQACLDWDRQYREQYFDVGSTAVFAILDPSFPANSSTPSSIRLTIGHVGDSRAYVFSGKDKGSLLHSTQDHHPNVESEYKRITEAGGWVTAKRVNGLLALSRAFGDYSFKPEKGHYVVATPEIHQMDIQPGDKVIKKKKQMCIFRF
jgi:serine/threonine protein phosphatase PrpC